MGKRESKSSNPIAPETPEKSKTRSKPSTPRTKEARSVEIRTKSSSKTKVKEEDKEPKNEELESPTSKRKRKPQLKSISPPPLKRKHTADSKPDLKENIAPKDEHEDHQSCKGSEDEEEEGGPKKKARKGKSKKAADMMPLAVRSAGLKMFLGAHVSMAGGIQNSVTNAVKIGGNSFALFLKSQRKWANPPLKAEDAQSFREMCKEKGYDQGKHVLPHGSYLVNLAQPEPDKAKQAFDAFVDDIKRCEQLGIRLYNFHPGSPVGHPRPEAISRIADALNRVHEQTSDVKLVLENMASSNAIGSRLEDLRDIIALVKDKSRVGVCWDTCHGFAAGYDIRTPKALASTLKEFDEKVGLRYLSAVHLNDSKTPLNSERDLHANIGTGFLGLRAFHALVNNAAFEDKPIVLETPLGDNDDLQIWADEIKLLEGLIGVDPDTDANFKAKEAELSKRGAAERKKHQDAFDKKAAKGKPKQKRTLAKWAKSTKPPVDSDSE